MAKLIITVVLLALVAGAVFYFGWIQIHLDENTYGVVFTKNSGWDDTVIVPGTFVWRWERLLPTNLKLHKYELRSVSTEVSLEGDLPSAAVYAAGIEPAPDFSFELTFELSFAVDPNALPRLASEFHILPDDLEDWYATVAGGMAERASTYLVDIADESDLPQRATALASFLENRLQDEVQTHFPDIRILRLLPTKIRMPDMSLYTLARAEFLATTTARHQADREAASVLAATKAKTDQWFDTLERYGNILERFPSLLDLFALEGDVIEKLLAEDTVSAVIGTN